MAKKTDDRLRPLWQANLSDHVIALAWSADSQQLAAAGSTGPIAIFNARGEVLDTREGHDGCNFALAWAGDCFASSGQDGHVRRGSHTLDAGSMWVEHLAAHSNGTLASSAGKTVRLWNAAGEMIGELPKFNNTVSGLAWQPGSRTLAVATYGGVSLWDGANRVTTLEWRGALLALAWSPNGRVLAHGNQDATVHFWDITTGTPLQMSGYPLKVRELAWDATSRYLATGGSETVCLWDCGGSGPAGSKPLMLEAHTAPITVLAYQRRGQLLASAARDGLLCVWQPLNAKKALVGSHRGPGECTVLAWSPDDKKLALGYNNGTFAMLNVS